MCLTIYDTFIFSDEYGWMAAADIAKRAMIKYATPKKRGKNVHNHSVKSIRQYSNCNIAYLTVKKLLQGVVQKDLAHTCSTCVLV